MTKLQQASLHLALLVGLTSCILTAAQAQGDCGPTRDLAACLPAAQTNVQPAAECCSVLRNIYLTSPNPDACLCEAATSSAFAASGANMQFAILIPQKCNLDFKAGTQCNGVRIPGGH